MTDEHFDLDAALKKSKDHFDLDAALSNNTGEDFSGVTGGASTTPVVGAYDKPIFTVPQGGDPENFLYGKNSGGGYRPKTELPVTPRDLANQVPNAAAMAASSYLGPEVGIPVHTGIAALMGGLGNAALQGGEKLADVPPSPGMFGVTNPVGKMLLEAGFQGVNELGGGLFKHFAGKQAAKLPATLEEKANEALAQKVGDIVTAGEVAPKLSSTELRLSKYREDTLKDAESLLGPYSTPHDAGKALHGGNIAAKKIADRVSTANYNKLADVSVDLGPHMDLIKALPEDTLPDALRAKLKNESSDPLRAYIEDYKAKLVNPSAKQLEFVRQGEQAGNTVSFDTLKEIRTAIGKKLDQPPDKAPMPGQTIGELKHTYKQLTGIMANAAEKAGKGTEWKEADTFHATMGDLYGKRGSIGRRVAGKAPKAPQKVIGLVGPHDLQAAIDQNKIFDYGNHAMATEEEKNTIAAARSSYQRAFLDQNIFNHPETTWKTKIANIGPEVVDEVLKTDPIFAKNIKTVANLTANISPTVPIGEDVAAAMTTPLGFGFHNRKNIIRDVTRYATPSVEGTRRLAEALRLVADKGPNYVRGIRSLAELYTEMRQSEPPTSTQKPQDTSFPPPPADPGLRPNYIRK